MLKQVLSTPVLIGISVLVACSSGGDSATNACYAALPVPSAADCGKPGTGLVLDAAACASLCRCDNELRVFIESLGKQIGAASVTDVCVPAADATLSCENLAELEPATTCRVCSAGSAKVNIKKSPAEVDCDLRKSGSGSP